MNQEQFAFWNDAASVMKDWKAHKAKSRLQEYWIGFAPGSPFDAVAATISLLTRVERYEEALRVIARGDGGAAPAPFAALRRALARWERG